MNQKMQKTFLDLFVDCFMILLEKNEVLPLS